MHLAPPPNARHLLPPLLACLPTAFVSPRPPPALLPLLSPILRQRLNFLASGTAPSDGWLPLLSWDARTSARLPSTVENMNLEPHPVSGELEFEDVRPAKYRRLDKETLQARLEVDQFDLLPIFVWCEKDEHGGTEPGWKLAELRTTEDLEDGTVWCDSPSEATDAASSRSASVAQSNGNAVPSNHVVDEDDDANDDYWALYDQTPGRTPAHQSPAPPSTSNRAAADSEADYYARYGQEVQPALDAHDPDEEQQEPGQSTLTGNALVQAPPARTESADYAASLQPHSSWKPEQRLHDSAHATSTEQSPEHMHEHLSMPRPISPTSSHSSVDRLEERAAEMSSETRSSDTAQLAVKQYISTDVKSLYRLAKASGMARAEFQRIVQRELEVLSIMDQDDL